MSVLRGPVLLAYAVFVLVGLSAGVDGVLLPAQMSDYGVDEATIGVTFFTFSAGYLLAGSTAGALVLRFGIRVTLVAGGGAFMLAALYTGIRPSFAGLVGVQVVAGYGIGLIEAVLNVFLARLPSAATLLNRLHAFFGVGALAGPLLAAWALDFLPWPAVWLMLGLVCLPLVAGFLLAFPGRDDQPVAGPARSGLLTEALRAPTVLMACGFLAAYVGLEMSVGNWGFTYLIDEHAQPGLAAGYTVSGYWLGLTAGRFLISPIATRIGSTTTGMIYACLGGVAASIAVIWLAPAALVAAAGFVLLGFFLGPLFPTAMAVVPYFTEPRLVPTAIGVMNGVSVVGGAAFPWLAGAVAQGAGVWTLMPFVMVLALLQLASWRFLVTRMAKA
ncbi:MFS transporter [Nonomuraea sp. LPB2021202275-12-8]|uniref:MFS transporter n=1 Tax=Nonomuraea sp. LPB2021202275-12-8 TaxID=3120159 RepID=UPI00300CAE78